MLHRIVSFPLPSLSGPAVAAGLLLLLLPPAASAQQSSQAVQVPDTADAVVQVRGMACSACARRMKRALEDVDGVDRATVLLKKQDVLLTLSAQKTPSEKILREAVTSAGYEFRGALFAREEQTEESSG
ncbi:MAG: heavy-metal-associated domain-containing protein [Salinibacter sp.]|uniref:heavy-metal-associated domain-containing protein n=1 Tax=Salinibacter sp. TaxID=2065818 RepID=UPI0035D477F2